MDILQIALIFLIVLLGVFLTITGIQVFFILRDLRRALDKLNKILDASEEIARDIEKPVAAAATLIGAFEKGVKTLTGNNKKPKAAISKPRRFFKKVL